MKVGIVGAGVSGLSLARLLMKSGIEVEVLEKNSTHGGIARTRKINDCAYHLVGGHCFNSKHQDVLDFVFGDIMPMCEWHLVKRKANILFKGNLINYPIEFSVKEIFKFDPSLAFDISKDFLSAEPKEKCKNLKEWFISGFGKTLANEYFIPYNEKIWGIPTEKMSPDWVDSKLPAPDKESFFKGLVSDASDSMPHSTFYYPNENDQNEFIDRLSRGCNIKYNSEVKSIERRGEQWVINGEDIYDILVNTSPLDCIGNILQDFPSQLSKMTKKLKYNRVTTMLWTTKAVDATWTYFPDSNTPFHRHIHIGNFFLPQKNYTITEAVGNVSYEDMKAAGRSVEYLLEPLDYHVSERAYVVFDENYKVCREAVLKYLNSRKLYSLGRFGEWEYYNMDVCIKNAIQLCDSITRMHK